jgi:hypothetical protein
MNLLTDAETPREISPDHAWKVLTVTNEWIRHADTKIGVTLAFVGATAGITYNIATRITTWTLPAVLALSFTAILLFAAATQCWLALFPRIGNGPNSPHPTASGSIFFGSIAKSYSEDAGEFRHRMALLTADTGALVDQIADQIGTNSVIAITKFTHSQRAISLEFAAAALLLTTATIAAAGW